MLGSAIWNFSSGVRKIPDFSNGKIELQQITKITYV